MQGKPAAAKAGVMLHKPEAYCVFSQRSCSWIMGPWQRRVEQGPGSGGVDSDLCFHTAFFMAVAAALGFHVHLWCLL